MHRLQGEVKWIHGLYTIWFCLMNIYRSEYSFTYLTHIIFRSIERRYFNQANFPCRIWCWNIFIWSKILWKNLFNMHNMVDSARFFSLHVIEYCSFLIRIWPNKYFSTILIVRIINDKQLKIFPDLHEGPQHIDGCVRDPIVIPLKSFHNLHTNSLPHPTNINMFHVKSYTYIWAYQECFQQLSTAPHVT